jgi:hypothetical protein
LKNKDKYNLNEVQFDVQHMVNGCGKRIMSSQTIIFYRVEEGKKYILFKKKTQDRVFDVFKRWLEDEV